MEYLELGIGVDWRLETGWSLDLGLEGWTNFGRVGDLGDLVLEVEPGDGLDD